MVKQIPITFLTNEYSFRDLNEWFEHAGPMDYIGMTLKQEMWYRFLLTPEQQLPKIVTFRGVPIIIVE